MNEESNPVGRPTKLTEEVVRKLEEVFALDGTVEEACFYAGISRQTYYEWIKENTELNDKFQALRERPILKARQTVVKSLDQPEYAFKYLERKKKKEFGNNLDVTSGDKPIPLLGVIKENVSDNDSNKENSQPEEKN
jgi:hypothetical protein